jgi:hypothetical protein
MPRKTWFGEPAERQETSLTDGKGQQPSANLPSPAAKTPMAFASGFAHLPGRSSAGLGWVSPDPHQLAGILLKSIIKETSFCQRCPRKVPIL